MSSWRAGAELWLRTRWLALARIVLVLQIVGLAFCIAGTHGAFVRLEGPPNTTDFASFYTAGVLANAGRAAAAYDPVAHLAAEQAAVAAGVEEKRYLNTPVFLLLCAPLARLPYLVAFVLFELGTALPWLWLTARIAAGPGAPSGVRQAAALCLAGTPAVFWALGWGQNSFLSAGLMAAATLLLATRPLLAGALLGCLLFKPHFGLLLPVALLAGGCWRVLLGAAASAGFLAAASALCFGAASWSAFLDAVRHASGHVENATQLAGHIDFVGGLRLFGLGPAAAWAVQGVASLAAAGLVGFAWSRARGEIAAARARACLVAGTLAAMPFLLFYDLVMATVAAAWLVRAARCGAPSPGLPAALAVCWLLSFVAFPAAAGANLAVGCLVGPILLWQARPLRGG